MTQEEAIKISETKFWETAHPADIVRFQLLEDRLCMPLELYQSALEQVLGRPVFTHELQSEELRQEYYRLPVVFKRGPWREKPNDGQ